jgi:hypothetical protein
LVKESVTLLQICDLASGEGRLFLREDSATYLRVKFHNHGRLNLQVVKKFLNKLATV